MRKFLVPMAALALVASPALIIALAGCTQQTSKIMTRQELVCRVNDQVSFATEGRELEGSMYGLWRWKDDEGHVNTYVQQSGETCEVMIALKQRPS